MNHPLADAARMRRAPALVRDLLTRGDDRGFHLENAAGPARPAARVRRAAMAVAGRLGDAAGPGDGDAVLIRVGDYEAAAIAMLGTWGWGGIPVPVPMTAPAPFIAQVVAECGPAAHITLRGTELSVTASSSQAPPSATRAR